MKFESLALGEFIDELGAGTPTPGGGCAAALCGAFAAALSTMVSRLTLGKEKFKSNWEDMGWTDEKARSLKDRLLALAQEDAEAYRQVILAWRLPKDTEEEKAVRAEAVENAMKNAARVPIETLRASESLMNLAEIVLKKGNPTALTDAGAALHLAHVAALVAAANVRANLSSIRDEVLVHEYRIELKKRLKRIEVHFAEANDYLESRLP